MAKTRAPGGLHVTRNGMSFTYHWTVYANNHNGGNESSYRIYEGDKGAWTKWTTIKHWPETREKTVSFGWTNYFPNKKNFFYAIQFCVRGREQTQDSKGNIVNLDWSDWIYNTWNIYCPYMPSVEASLDDEHENVCTFSWSGSHTDQDNDTPFRDCEWQSILVKESNVTDGSKLSWNSGVLGWMTGTNGNTSYSRTITEDPELISKASYTRWFRVRGRGPGGNGWNWGGAKRTGCSYWRYAKHVYAWPELPKINYAFKDGSRFWVRVNWFLNNPASHPTDRVDVQYTIGVPKAGLKPQDGASWTTARSFADTSNNDEVTFFVDDTLSLALDQLIWVRIVATHDKYSRPSDPICVTNIRPGTTPENTGLYPLNTGLTPPTFNSIDINYSTKRVTVNITNNSEVPDSKIALVFNGPGGYVIGILNHGVSELTVNYPNNFSDDLISFYAYAFQGSVKNNYSSSVHCNNYTINYKLKSTEVSPAGGEPKYPTNVRAALTDLLGEALVTWTWSWPWWQANRAEISWSKNKNAWESTEEPSKYSVTSLNPGRLRVTGLDAGETYYFRVRLGIESEGFTVYGPYGATASLTMGLQEEEEEVVDTTAPTLSFGGVVIRRSSGTSQVIQPNISYKFPSGDRWNYFELCVATVTASVEEGEYVEVIEYGTPFLSKAVSSRTELKGVQYSASAFSNLPEGVYMICARVRSNKGKFSNWSAPSSLTIAANISCTVATTSLQSITIPATAEAESRTVLALTEMPLTVKVNGAGTSNITAITIQRTNDFHTIGPDENDRGGYANEAVLSYSQTGDATITINRDSLIGTFDDDAQYTLTASVASSTDSYGAASATPIRFEVHWSHQAIMPEAEVELVEDKGAAILRPIAPQGVITGDVCDIYRLSVDKPELVYENAEFGEVYVDPYPTIGEFGGYRFVFKTSNGDYITAEKNVAWNDIPSNFNTLNHIINFGNSQVELMYNVDLSHSWAKDFKETTYLGGSIQGDWNPAVSRTGTISGVVITATDQDTIEKMRRLAVYSGICHVRTRDGSSYSADVEVSESKGSTSSDLTTDFNLSITRVDPERPDGMLYSDWEEDFGGE